MVYPFSRSMNGALSEGMTDGKYKKVVQDRDLAEGTTWAERRDLNDNWYGIHELRDKVAPDGLVHPTPNYVPTSVTTGDVY